MGRCAPSTRRFETVGRATAAAVVGRRRPSSAAARSRQLRPTVRKRESFERHLVGLGQALGSTRRRRGPQRVTRTGKVPTRRRRSGERDVVGESHARMHRGNSASYDSEDEGARRALGGRSRGGRGRVWRRRRHSQRRDVGSHRRRHDDGRRIVGADHVVVGRGTDGGSTTPSGGSEAPANPNERRPEDPPNPVKGGTLVYGLEADTANPWAPFNCSCATSGRDVLKMVSDALFTMTKDGEPVPLLARDRRPQRRLHAVDAAHP